jgi:hypothetical protein
MSAFIDSKKFRIVRGVAGLGVLLAMVGAVAWFVYGALPHERTAPPQPAIFASSEATVVAPAADSLEATDTASEEPTSSLETTADVAQSEVATLFASADVRPAVVPAKPVVGHNPPTSPGRPVANPDAGAGSQPPPPPVKPPSVTPPPPVVTPPPPATPPAATPPADSPPPPPSKPGRGKGRKGR